jgi:hypothetical protein
LAGVGYTLYNTETVWRNSRQNKKGEKHRERKETQKDCMFSLIHGKEKRVDLSVVVVTGGCGGRG